MADAGDGPEVRARDAGSQAPTGRDGGEPVAGAGEDSRADPGEGREDLRHLLKHKRMYCAHALTPVERRVLKRHSWLREAWFATGKPVYRFVTRKLLKWEDNEGQGPKP